MGVGIGHRRFRASRWILTENIGSGALFGKMLLVRIIENNKIDALLGQVRLRKG